jgi:hypothetical protein
MRPSHAIFAIALTAATLGGSAIAASSAADRASVRADWLTIPAIHEKVTAAGYNDIHEIERERGGYKIKAYDRDGYRVKLFVDPVSGEVLNARAKKDKSDKYRDERDRSNDRYSSDLKG